MAARTQRSFCWHINLSSPTESARNHTNHTNKKIPERTHITVSEMEAGRPLSVQSRVAGLLRSGNIKDDTSTEGLKKVMSRIDQFFVEARSAPQAVCLEMNDGDDDVGERGEEDGGQEVQLSLVAGVLEARPKLQLSQVGGVVLPTEENLQLLEAEKMRDSEALLRIFAALQTGDDNKVNQRRARGKTVNRGTVEAERGHDEQDDEGSSSSSSCVYMDASDLSSDDDEDCPKRKRLVVELD